MEKEPLTNQQQASIGCGVTIGVILFLIVTLFIVFDSGDTPQSEKNLEIGAWVYAKDAVKNQLVSPSTAKFPAYFPGNVIQSSNDLFTVTSYVDSQNRLGATVRSFWSVELIYLGEDVWSVLTVNIY